MNQLDLSGAESRDFMNISLKKSWLSSPISLIIIFSFFASFTPASAATNLQVTVNRSNGAYLSASKTRMPNSTAEKAQISAAMKKYCYDYNYLGVIGDSGQYLRSNLVKSTYKLLKTKRTNTRYGTEIYIDFTCSYVTTLKNLGDSNSFVVDFSRDSFGAGSIKSPRYSFKEISGAGWRVSLELNGVSDPVWTPKATPVSAVFEPTLVSEGCTELFAGKFAKVRMYDPNGYLSGLRGAMEFTITHAETLSVNPITMSDFLRDDLLIYDTYGPATDWSPYSGGFYFRVNESINAYGKIVVVKKKGFITPERSLISVLISPKCEILEVVNLGKF